MSKKFIQILSIGILCVEIEGTSNSLQAQTSQPTCEQLETRCHKGGCGVFYQVSEVGQVKQIYTQCTISLERVGTKEACESSVGAARMIGLCQ